MQFDYFIDQRIANQVESLKKRKDRATNYDQNTKNDDDEDDFDGYVAFTDIEHLQEYKQVRVGFEGKYLSEWKGALYYFIIKYNNYPISPVRIEFPKEFRHQYIIQNTGVYCHPDWSEKYWKKSMTLEQIINRVISTFHEIPTYSDYPVDLSFVQLSLNKDEYQQVIKENKYCATNYTSKITDERQYYLQKRQQNEDIKKKKKDEENRRIKEEENRRIQKDEQQKIILQKQEYQEMINRQQNQIPQQQNLNNPQYNNRAIGNPVFNSPINQIPTQLQQQPEVQKKPQTANPNYQQQQFNNPQSFNSGQIINNSYPSYNQNPQNQQYQLNQQNVQNQQIQPQQQQQVQQINQPQPQIQQKIKILHQFQNQ